MVSENKSVSVSTNYKYISFQEELDLDLEHPPISEVISHSGESGGRRTISAQGLELDRLEFEDECSLDASHRVAFQPISEPSNFPKRVRLRAVSSEQEYFLRILNVSLCRKLALGQGIASTLIIIFQLILYVIMSRVDFKLIHGLGISIWAPILFFSPAAIHTWITIRLPNGCTIGTAMGNQIISIIVGLLLIFMAFHALMAHGRMDWDTGKYEDPDTTEKIFYSLILLNGVAVTMIALTITSLLCRVTCCGKSNANENLVYDVEEVM